MRVGFCIIWLLACTGCAVGPDFVRPLPPDTDRYRADQLLQETVAADGLVQYFEQEAEVIANWWQLFQSPQLNALVQEAIGNNFNLQAAQAGLQQSQENLRAGYGVFFPQIDVAGDFTRQRFSSARFGRTFGDTPSSIFNLFTLSAAVSYTLDVFGAQRRTVESLNARRDIQHYTVLATYLTLTGNVVNTAIAWAAYQAQIEATQQLIESQQQQVRLTEFQLQAGLVPHVNLVNLRSQLAVLEATLPLLEQQRGQAEHLLATLTGHTPAEFMLPEIDLADLALPANLPVTLPSRLVRQRPDILAAEAQLQEYNAYIGVATAAMFPSFTLSGNYGQNNRNLLDIFMSSGNFWSVGANFVAPLFHGGTLWFQREAAIEAYQQSLASYRQITLDALAQVADVLLALQHGAEVLQQQSQELKLAQERMNLVQTNYRAGLVDYQQPLIAVSQYYQSKLSYLQTLGRRFQDTAALFVALGGGWWNKTAKVLSTPDSETKSEVELSRETGKTP